MIHRCVSHRCVSRLTRMVISSSSFHRYTRFADFQRRGPRSSKKSDLPTMQPTPNPGVPHRSTTHCARIEHRYSPYRHPHRSSAETLKSILFHPALCVSPPFQVSCCITIQSATVPGSFMYHGPQALHIRRLLSPPSRQARACPRHTPQARRKQTKVARMCPDTPPQEPVPQ